MAERADDAISSMVRDYARNMEVFLSDGGLLSTNSNRLTIIVISTLDPDSMYLWGGKIEATADVLPAAVSDGATGAQGKHAAIMASGPEDRVEAARSYFHAVGSNTS